ncbi:hypothetical protein BDF20DRAFT_887891 [Mycotypha africana]|uniref:uncharacterized protein n=1 Tax=Mycotypha africana TaxID=64632 RepID=UPI002300A1A6|nr:uncharacterized protein BDF20DRAFT_887891 [Mycotypha africana]KAI8972005.1 hypothetical protein BDF20DRAFT_887891 [Mycotypha africana]
MRKAAQLNISSKHVMMTVRFRLYVGYQSYILSKNSQLSVLLFCFYVEKHTIPRRFFEVSVSSQVKR